MTELEWRQCRDPWVLLRHKLARDDRRLRLVDCACVRRVLHFLSDTRFSDAVVAAEDLADGKLTWDGMKATARRKAATALRELRPRLGVHYSRYAAEAVLAMTNRQAKNDGMCYAAAAIGYTTRDYHANLDGEKTEQLKLVHDIFGNPFRPVAFAPSWRTPTAVALARQMYDARDFSLMPILADALQDAGCEDTAVHDHCRGDGPHVRGCWVVDLVLGKSRWYAPPEEVPAMSAVVTPPPLSAAPSAPPAAGWTPFRWTVAEYRRLGDLGMFEDVKVMLLDGEIFTMTMPKPPHDVALGLTDAWLRTVFTVGHHVRSQMGFDVGTRNGPEPDLAVVRGTIRDYATKTPAAAVMVVEVAESSLFIDTTTKAEKYATACVPDYWVIDLENRAVLVFRDPEALPAGLGATAYRTRLTLGPADTVAPLAAPASAVKVADLLP